MDRNTAGLILSVILFAAYAIFAVAALASSIASQGTGPGLSLLADGVILILLGYGVYYFWSVRQEARRP
jgi:hypothetical protein